MPLPPWREILRARHCNCRVATPSFHTGGSRRYAAAPSTNTTRRVWRTTAAGQTASAYGSARSAARAAPLRRDQNLAANPPENASAEVVSGPVTEIRDAMTWIIGGRIVHLWGIRSTSRTPTPSLVRFADRMKAENPISCHRQPHSTRYRCFTASREDIAEMALLSGVGQPAIGAPVAYRAAAVLSAGKGAKR